MVKRKRGRPYGSGEGIDRPVKIMVTEEEREAFNAYASARNTTVSALGRKWIRRLLRQAKT